MRDINRTKAIIKFLPLTTLFFLLYIFHVLPHEQHNVVVHKKIEYGTYGLPFTTMPPKTKKRVILLGNSVFQLSGIVSEIEALKKTNPAIDFEIGNFSMCGSSIADYIIIYNYVRKYDPDLIIAHIVPMTFGYEAPLFRTEAKKLIFLPEMKRIRTHEIFDLYTRDELVESFLYSFFPIIRTHIITRVKCKKAINNLALKIGALPVMNFFPYTLNTAGDWMQTNNVTAFAQRTPKEQPALSELLPFFFNQLSKDKQKIVFIEQENNMTKLPINDRFPGMAESHENIHYYNFKNYYQEKHYSDNIHPSSREELNRVALRLYNIIVKHLQDNS